LLRCVLRLSRQVGKRRVARCRPQARFEHGALGAVASQDLRR